LARHGILVALLLCTIATPARAALGTPDTVVADDPDVTYPVLALDPSTQLPHVAFVSSHTLWHAWLAAGVWQSEVVASGVPESSSLPFHGVDLAFGPTGPMVVYRSVNQLVCARRVGGIWQPESLDVHPGSIWPTLAISPLTGEPVVAWASRPVPNGVAEIRLARRSGSTWTTVTVDTTSAKGLQLSLALDPNDRPRIAWTRPRADELGLQVVTVGAASGPMGPFDSAPVDSTMSSSGFLSLALDPFDGQPRVAYTAQPPGDLPQVRYAALDILTGWQVTRVDFANATPWPVSLAIGPTGDPFVAMTWFTNVSPQDVETGESSPSLSCLFIRTGSVCRYHRVGGTGTGTFDLDQCLNSLIGGGDQTVGPHGLAASALGTVGLAWRTPGQTCAPYDLLVALDSPFAGVGPDRHRGIALAPVAPNPLRAGAGMRLTFSLDAARSVVFELHDAAGRTVASRDFGVLGPGAHAVPWAPATPRAGFYWVTLRADGRSLATRPAVIVR